MALIPADLVIDHLCRNRGCQNMTHMELVTPGENVLRGESFSARNAHKTHCPQGHPYSGDNLYVDPKGRRYCRICQRVKDHKRYKGAKAPTIAKGGKPPGKEQRHAIQ